MAEDNVTTNIVVNSNFSDLIGDLNKASAALMNFKDKLSVSNKALAQQVAVINRTFAETMRSTGQFSTHFVSLNSDVEKFGTQLDKGQIKLNQFFRVFNDHTKTSGGIIRQLAQQQVQLQNSILQPLGRNAEGLMQYNVQIPRGLDLVRNKTALAKQELQILNKVVQEGSNQLINWGKNTQWAGRQLTVGLTVPLAAFGKAAADAFQKADQELVRLTKVYGGVAATSAADLKKVREDVAKTAAELSKSYGASFQDTIALAADIAATGKQGNELLNSVRETTRLAVLGEVDRQDAMKATLAIQTAFKENTQQLGESINFLNAVENQTSTTLADLVEAIPKAGPVIKGLGGDVKDLALYLTAMKEGGISATEGANALKSGLASLINPTKTAKDMFMGFGINLESIVTRNAGNTTATILELQSALDQLDPLKKQKALEQLFGKFQFARMNALFSNLGKQGSQTLQVLDLMKASSQDLAKIAGRELSQVTDSASGKYRRALEGLKADLAGVGSQFLEINTALINIVDKVIQFTNHLPKPLKQLLSVLGMLTATAGPLIMLTGVMGNFIGYVVKGIFHLRSLFKGGEGWKLLTPEILAASKAGSIAEQTFYSDAKAASVFNQSVQGLLGSLAVLESKLNAGVLNVAPQLYSAAGGLREVNPNHPLLSAKDTRSMSHMNPVAGMTPDQRQAQTLFGVVPGAPKVNQKIGAFPQIYMTGDLPKISGVTSVGGASTGVVASEAAKWHSMTAALAMQSQAEIAKLKTEVATTGLVTEEVSTAYQTLLPKMNQLVENAAAEAAQIVQSLQSGKMTADAARAEITALNARVEQMMAQTAASTATSLGRTIDITKVPLLDQPIVDAAGKSNLKELTKPGRTRDLLNKIAGVLGVKTYGAGYSIETTRPKRLNQGDIVPGTGNQDTVPAMLTPGEFIVNKKATEKNLPLLQAINQNKEAGFQNSRGGWLNPKIANAILKSFGVASRSNKKQKLLGNWGMLLPNAVNRRLLSGKATGIELHDALKDKNALIDLRSFLEFSSVSSKDINRVMSRVARDMRSKIDKNGLYSDPKFGELAFESITPAIQDLESQYKGITEAYHNDRKLPGRRDTKSSSSKHGPSPSGINVPGSRGSSYASGYGSGNERMVWAHFHDQAFLDNIEKLVRMFAKNPVKLSKGGLLRGFYKNWKSPLGSGGIPMFKGPVKSPLNYTKEYADALLRSHQMRFDRLPKDANGQYWYTPDELRLFREGKASLGTYPKPKTYYQDMSNDDPAHGPLQIGKYRGSLHVRNQYVGPKVTYSAASEGANWMRMTSSPVIAGGSIAERAKSALYRYMQGDYSAIDDPSVQAYLSTIRTKFTGRLHRGIDWRSSDNIPAHIKSLIAKGEWDKLIGQEFIMRRSSWSKNSETAKGFGHDANGKLYNQVVMTADVKNRNAVPASEIFPDLTFQSPSGPVPVNESEVYMGGKFRIVGASKGKLQLQAVYDAKREKGGPVSANRPYLVGEKGPELFVPKNAGGIIPHYGLGGLVGGAAKFILPMIGGQMAASAVDKMQLPGMAGMAANIAAWSGGAAATSKMLGMIIPKTTEAAKETSKYSKVIETLNFVGSKIPGWGKVAAVALTAVAAASYGAWEKARKARIASQEAIKLDKDKVGQVGITYKSLIDNIKETTNAYIEQSRLLKAKAAGADAVGGGVNLTISQFKDLQKQIKAASPDIIKMFNEMNKNDVVKNVADLKAQLVSAGKSAQDATNYIYTMLSLTNKKGMSSEALGSSDFRAIADQATAAQYSTKTAGLAFKSGNKMDAKELVNTFDQGLTSIDQYFSSIEKVKNSTGKLVVDNQAVAKTIDMIKKSEMGRQQIGQDTLDELIKQKPELSVILNKSDTIADAWVKTKLYTSGITADLSKISGADAAKMLQVVEAIRTAADAMTKTDTNKATNPMLYGLARAYTSSQSAAKTAAELAKRASDAAQVDLNAEIKLIDKKIQLINDEFDARKKLIDYTAAKETYQNQLAQEQLKYQQAIANGDQTGAAQAQINMRQLNQEYQKQEALRVLEEKRNAEIKAWEDKKAKMQEDAALLQAKAAKLQAAAATAQQKANSIAIIQQSIANTLTQAAVTKDESRLKLYAKSLQSDINSLKKLDPSNASLINPIMTSSTDSNGKTTASADWMATLKDLISGKNNLLSDAGTTFKDGAELFKQYVSKLLGLAPVGTGGVKADLAGLAGTRTGKGVTGDPYVYKNAAGQSITEKQWNSMPLSAPKGSTAYKVPSTNISGQTYSGRDEIINAFRDEFKKDNVTADGFKYLAQGQVVKGGKMVGLWFQPLADQSGRYKAYRRGGLLRGPGTGTSDSIFMPQMSGGRFASGAYVSTGEYVVNAKATSQPGILGLLDKINNQSFNMPARTSFNASSNFSGNGMITTPVINVYGAAGQDERMIGEIVMARLSDWTAKQNSQMRAIGTSKVVGGR